MQNNFDIVDRDIFDDPLSESEIVEFLKYTDIDYMFAKRSPSVKKMGLDVDTMSEQEKIQEMLKEPRLIRRPLVVYENRVSVGADLNLNLLVGVISFHLLMSIIDIEAGSLRFGRSSPPHRKYSHFSLSMLNIFIIILLSFGIYYKRF